MNIPFRSNVRTRIIIALIYPVSASLIDSWASPPEPLILCSKLNSDPLTHRPAYLFLHPLFFYLLHYNFPNHKVWEKTPFSVCLFFLPYPATQSIAHHIKYTKISKSIYCSSSLLPPKYLMPRHLIAKLHGFHS